MAFVEYNPNPVGRKVGDCSVRAISKALNMGWEASYIALVMVGLQMGDVMNADSVWGSLLKNYGFRRRAMPDTCPACYTVEDFCEDNRHGIYVLGTGGHVVTTINGDWFDSWDSAKEVVQFVWYREE